MIILPNSIQLAFSDAGQGAPVLFVHGYPLHRGMWQPQISDLGNHFRLLAPDLRGHGDSQPVPGIYTMDSLADDLAAFLDCLNVSEPVTLCGLSMGGYISLAFARLYPERLRSLVLAATKATPDTPEARQNRDRQAELALREGVAAVVQGLPERLLAPVTIQTRPDLVDEVRQIMLKTSVEGLTGTLAGMRDRIDSRPFLAELDLPVLVIHGAQDQLIPLQEAQNMSAAIPNARLAVLEAAGHLLNMEQPAAFNAALKDFLTK
jgi:3-oxoadipate enol-lactonase